MATRRKPDARCEICVMRHEVCLCPEIAKCGDAVKDAQTRIVVLMHHRELCLTTSTARLAALTLPQCEIRIRGLKDEPLNTEGIIESDRQTLFLFPSEDALPLNEVIQKNGSKNITLIVPDGSWRQAAKVAKREAFLKDIPRVFLPAGLESGYKLRREPKLGGLATVEAIARALTLIEGENIGRPLEDLFTTMVNRTLLTRRGAALTPPQLKSF